jgi:hypothetical protein
MVSAAAGGTPHVSTAAATRRTIRCSNRTPASTLRAARRATLDGHAQITPT